MADWEPPGGENVDNSGSSGDDEEPPVDGGGADGEAAEQKKTNSSRSTGMVTINGCWSRIVPMSAAGPIPTEFAKYAEWQMHLVHDYCLIKRKCLWTYRIRHLYQAITFGHCWAGLKGFTRKSVLSQYTGSGAVNPTELLRDLEEMWGGDKYQATDEDVLYLSQGSRDMLEQCSEAYKSVKLATRCTVARRRQFLKDHKATITFVRDWVLLNATSERSNSKNPGKRDLLNLLTGKEC